MEKTSAQQISPNSSSGRQYRVSDRHSFSGKYPGERPVLSVVQRSFLPLTSDSLCVRKFDSELGQSSEFSKKLVFCIKKKANDVSWCCTSQGKYRQDIS